MSSVIFQDEFRVEQLNPDGKKFEKGAFRFRSRRLFVREVTIRRPQISVVDRLMCKGIVYELEFLIGTSPLRRATARPLTRPPSQTPTARSSTWERARS